MRTEAWRRMKIVGRNYARIMGLVWQCGPALTLGLFFLSLLLGIAPLVSFAVTKHVVNAITESSGRGGGWPALWPWLAALVGVQVGRLAAGEFREVQSTAVRESLDAWLSERVATAACHADLPELQTAEFQDALNRAQGETGYALDELVWWLVDSVQ